MAQHDYIISNQTFPNTRADINNVLQALATNNSGTTAPTTQYAGQFWLDTNTPSSTTWTLYIHDGSDDIAFATIDTSANTVNFTDSALDVVTDTTPQLGGNLDLNSNDITGTGNINITGSLTASGNLTSLGIDDNADATAITIDSSERVGIGTTSPSQPLDVVTTGGTVARFVDDNSGIVRIGNNTTGTGNSAQVQLVHNDVDGARIISESTEDFASSANRTANLQFKLRVNGNVNEIMRLQGSNIGIGTTAPSRALTVSGSTAPILALVETGTSGSSSVFFGDSSADNVGKIQYLHSSNDLAFVVNSSESMRIDSSGNVGIGISSPGTKLDVNGDFKFGSSASRNFFGDFGTTDLYLINNNSGTMRFHVGGGASADEKMRVLSDGKVGIGVSAPDRELTVGGVSNARIGILSNDNVVGASQLQFGDPDNSQIGRIYYEHSDNSMRFHTNNTEATRIDSSGNLLVGTTTSGYKLNVNGISNFNGYSNWTSGSELLWNGGDIGITNSGQSMLFKTYSSGSLNERMRINQNGNIQIATTTESGRLHIASSTFAGTDPLVVFSDASGTTCGSIDLNASGNTVAYVTSSDYRLKENVNYNFDATTRLKQLKPARFNFIADADTTVDGFIAHEVSSVVPEAISGEKDATKTKEKVVVNANGNVIAENIEQADWEAGKIADENGNTQYPTDSTWEATKVVPVYQGIDQSKLVPLLVKTIQELEGRITALETNNP